uniref:Uncharacterized protein n=1 Tax=Microplitis mediator bracovirus TaxID=1836595 RepID=A0A1C8XNG8_9VIRU|nr:hypothetical protein A6F54_87 [Microplitis mediator bracovirus]
MVPPEEIASAGNPDIEGENILHYLCREGDITNLMAFKNVISDANRHLVRQYNRHGKQCVHIVSNPGIADPQEKLKLLMEWGADINGQERVFGNTPLHITAYTRNHKLATWLCNQPGINMGLYNYLFKTPYYVACERNDIKMINILRAKGARGGVYRCRDFWLFTKKY